MKYHIMINTLGFDHPAFPCDSLEEALQKIEAAIQNQLFVEKAKGFMAVQLGAGTHIRLMSEEAIREEAKERQEAARNPLMMRNADAGEWKLAVQIGGTQLPALDFATAEDAQGAMEDAVSSGVFRHIIRAEHEYLYVCTGPGIVYIAITAEHYATQRRRAIEERMRAAQQPTANRSVILGPGGRPRN
jgi:hypothetical protein